MIKSLCVYCGANFNGDPKLKEAIDKLAEEMVKSQITLVYGGGSVGVMGLIADAVLALGGKVIGVIPQFLMDKEVGHRGVTEMIITENMHQRKQKMADISDAFLILPGGFGTLEEFFEVLTWLQLGLHKKAIAVLNFNNYYDFLFKQLDVMVDQKFLKPINRDLVIDECVPEEIISRINAFNAEPDDVWFTERNLT